MGANTYRLMSGFASQSGTPESDLRSDEEARMNELTNSKLLVNSFSISIAGYSTGPNQSLENPLGDGGEAIHEWIVAPRMFQQVSGNEGGTTGEEDELAACGFDNIGAWPSGPVHRYCV